MAVIQRRCRGGRPHARVRVAWLFAVWVACVTCVACVSRAPALDEAAPEVSNATTIDEAGMVDVRSLAPDISQAIAYHGSDNFVGAPVDGYLAPRCWLKREAAEALAGVEAALRERSLRLRIFDCYRPARAVAHFMRWAADPVDLRTKATHYPDFDKPELLGGYIAPVSGHSRGTTVDLTLLRCDDRGGDCEPLDMGTGFDFFGTLANTDSPDASAEQRANRRLLLEAMEAGGFANYPMEWWHFSHQAGPAPAVLYDVPVDVPGDMGRQAEIERLMQPYDGDAPGASLLVLKDGEAVVRRGWGRSDLARGTQAGPETGYRLASVSKPFTAAAVLLLAQDGKLSIDDPVRRWLPSLPAAADGILVRHLLEHSAGLYDYEDLMQKPWPGQILDAGVLALLEKEERLHFPPGSAYRYSNSGYALLALVVERASGMDFADYLRSRIFLPLGMRDTHARVDGGPGIPYRAWGYSAAEGGGWQPTDQNAYSAVLGDGGIYSSIDDLARWDAALGDDRLFTAETRALAFGRHVQVASGPEVTYYGFGWRVSADGGRQWHNGESIGFRNAYVRWPMQGLTVVLLSNRNDPTPYRTALAIGALFTDDASAPSSGDGNSGSGSNGEGQAGG